MKKVQKKLSLNAETVRTLTPGEQGQVMGGKTTAITCTCPTTRTIDAARTQYCTTAIRCTTGG